MPPLRGPAHLPARPGRRDPAAGRAVRSAAGSSCGTCREGLVQPAAEDPEVVVEVGPGGRWVAEYYPHDSAEELPDGGLRITLRTPDPASLRRLALRLGRDGRIVAAAASWPESARRGGRGRRWPPTGSEGHDGDDSDRRPPVPSAAPVLFKAACPDCRGRFELAAGALRLAIGASRRTTFYSFTCPECGTRSASRPASGSWSCSPAAGSARCGCTRDRLGCGAMFWPMLARRPVDSAGSPSSACSPSGSSLAVRGWPARWRTARAHHTGRGGPGAGGAPPSRRRPCGQPAVGRAAEPAGSPGHGVAGAHCCPGLGAGTLRCRGPESEAAAATGWTHGHCPAFTPAALRSLAVRRPDTCPTSIGSTSTTPPR